MHTQFLYIISNLSVYLWSIYVFTHTKYMNDSESCILLVIFLYICEAVIYIYNIIYSVMYSHIHILNTTCTHVHVWHSDTNLVYY